MQIHKFIDGSKPVMVLIHGVLTPWQIWTPQITAFKERYNIYAVALSAHTEENASEFVSLSAEVNDIIEYFRENNIHTIDVLCGISFGGKISFEIWKGGRLDIRSLVMDGAPLLSCPKFAVNIMVNNYKNIIRKSKARDAKVIESFKKSFLPEKYLGSYLKIADNMTENSVENIINSAFSESITAGADDRTKILFIHGTKGNEVISKKSAKLVKSRYPSSTEIVCFKGDTHCYKMIYEPQKWIETTEEFLENVSL